jgi:outer membrane receptor protein involved in Fe transport
VANYTAGLTIEDSSWPNASRISLRGLQVDAGRSSVGILLDDIDISTESVYNRGTGFLINMRLMDAERIEVVKGPQAALYGRSAFGGAINYISKRPSMEELAVKASLDASSEREVEITGSVGGPLIENKLALRLTGALWDERGSYKNTVSDKHLGGQSGVGGAGAFLFTPTENVSVYGRAEYSSDHWEQRPAVVLQANQSATFTPAQAAALGGATSVGYYSGKVSSVPEDIQLSLDPYTFKDYFGTKVDTFTSTLITDVSFDDVAVKFLTGWIDQDAHVNQDTDFRITPNVPGGQIPFGWTSQEWDALSSLRIFSQEMRIYSDNDNRFQWLIGAQYWEEEVDQSQIQSTVFPLTDQITMDFVHDLFKSNRTPRQRKYGRDTYHKSAFAWAEVDITDQLALSAEVRYSDENIDYSTKDMVNLWVVFAPDNLFNINPNYGPNDQPIVRVKDSFVTPKVTLRYQPNEDSTLYATVAKGVKPAGHKTSGTEIFDEVSAYDAETLWSYELGAKTKSLDGRLIFNGALYYQDYKDQQVIFRALDAAVEGATIPKEFTENAGVSTRWGLELDGTFLASENITLFGSYSYIDAEFDDYEVLSNDPGRAAEVGCSEVVTNNGAQNCRLIYTGNRPGRAPKHQLTATGNWTAPMTDEWDYFIETNARFTSKRFAGDANVVTLDSYWRVDLRAGVVSDKIEGMFYVNNLFDSRTVTDGFTWFDYQTVNFQPNFLTFLPDPLTIGVRFNYRM